jgi:hypothetical protein
LNYHYQQGEERELMGVTFDYPEGKVVGMQLLAHGPYRVWKNRLKGVGFDSWPKKYNNGITGERWEYPEFKGYYANFYGARMQSREDPFTILCGSENLFLHMLNPATPQHASRTQSVAPFPASAGISFLHGIPDIGTQNQKPEDLGPQSQKNLNTANGHVAYRQAELFFDFR